MRPAVERTTGFDYRDVHPHAKLPFQFFDVIPQMRGAAPDLLRHRIELLRGQPLREIPVAHSTAYAGNSERRGDIGLLATLETNRHAGKRCRERCELGESPNRRIESDHRQQHEGVVLLVLVQKLDGTVTIAATQRLCGQCVPLLPRELGVLLPGDGSTQGHPGPL